ncbi:hypothetical protein [uncultured Oscillibacter sp.]|uniref:hypothetical protein n=1 Tax=uncultured Oscillibacter sp. TaxID=876091 RepID=UPI00280B60CE|nr:hypothetical protein [uncultured Oscillibacter sp.]
MDIQHNHSYLSADDRAIIAHGYGVELPHSLNLRFQYTEVELCANRIQREQCSPDEWEAICRQEAIRKSEAIHAVMDVISKAFICYQYDHDRSLTYRNRTWDLFFWCNSFSNTMRGYSMSGRDYSDTRLSFNEEHDTETRLNMYTKVLSLIETQFNEDPNLHLVVQYKLYRYQEKIDTKVKELLPQMLGHPCYYHQMDGKIVETEKGIFFMKKYARTRGYPLDNSKLLLLYWAQFEGKNKEDTQYGS